MKVSIKRSEMEHILSMIMDSLVQSQWIIRKQYEHIRNFLLKVLNCNEITTGSTLESLCKNILRHLEDMEVL